jgi:serine phosphatase RsbU (regulator of sigma subunit)
MRFSLIFLIVIQAFQLLASPVNLDREKIYVRRGFEEGWIDQIPGPGDKQWLVVPGVRTGPRKVVLKELPLPGMPRRSMFSLETCPPENFTFLTAFDMDEKHLSVETLRGVFFANIGENWAVYLNGRLLRSEIHLDDSGGITRYRHMRDVLIPVDPRIFRAGRNILAVRIIGDPANIDSGFHRSEPFVIDDLKTLEKERSEQTALVLIFLYLFFGAYHLFIYARRKEEKYNLYYAAFSILLFAYLLSRTNAIYALIPDSTVLHRVEYCSLYSLVPLFGAFAELLLAGRLGRITKIYGTFYSLLILATVMPVSNSLAIDILRVWQVSVVVPLFYYLFISIGKPFYAHMKSLYQKYRYLFFPYRAARALFRSLALSTSGNLLLGATVVAGCAVFDIADSMFWAYNYVLTTYGFFAFTMGITLILANRFISTHRQLELTNEINNFEMQLAAHMQKLILPPVPADVERWDLAMAFKPRFGASGDFYDFYYDNNRLQGISLFDVSGHGVSSALITMMVKPITFRLFNTMGGESLDRIIELLDEHVSRELDRLDNYVTCVLLRFSESMVEYVNAGHPDLLHRMKKNGEVRTVGDPEDHFRSGPLGMGVVHHRATPITFSIDKGDLLLLFTDCVLDSKNPRGETFGLRRLMDSLADAPGGSARDILDYIEKRFYSFTDGTELRDDFTIILAKNNS